MREIEGGGGYIVGGSRGQGAGREQGSIRFVFGRLFCFCLRFVLEFFQRWWVGVVSFGLFAWYNIRITWLVYMLDKQGREKQERTIVGVKNFLRSRRWPKSQVWSTIFIVFAI